MSTAPEVPYSELYPLLFEIRTGPTFARIAEAARYYHDPRVSFPVSFRGALTDLRTGRQMSTTLVAGVFGFVSGTSHTDGIMTVHLHFPGYALRFGPSICYNFRHPRKSDGPLQLSRNEKVAVDA